MHDTIHAMEQPAFWYDGLRFSCTRCSHCCRHESGYVFLSSGDLTALRGFLGLSETEFIDTYCRWVPFGFGAHLSLREKSNKDCVFWRDGGCSVYDARPTQCRTYPFWSSVVDSLESWERESRECPGIGIGPPHRPEEITRALDMRRMETPILRSEGSES